jgi:N-acetylglucosaminyldiphosphoundecaprenol N-acetyl-beta-D-mannosaminyltransferase
MRDHAEVDVLGVRVSAVTFPQALEVLDDLVTRREPAYVTVTGVHGVMESQRDDELLAIHNEAALVCPDGMPLVWCGHRAGAGWVDRVYGPDLMLAVLERSVRHGWRHFFYGGRDGVADQLADRMRERFPGLQLAGTYCPPFRELTPDEEVEIAGTINDRAPDIVWVGLSTPKQERWMSHFRRKLQAPVLVGVGAAFDFHAGLLRQAPPVLQHAGLEWAFRLAVEPRRLWRRYLRNIPTFLWLLLRDRGAELASSEAAAKQANRLGNNTDCGAYCRGCTNLAKAQVGVVCAWLSGFGKLSRFSNRVGCEHRGIRGAILTVIQFGFKGIWRNARC